ncbi:MAG: helix-turn-helix domain-containing protein [Candidatus Zixiibacteriota bacterium]
MTAETLSKALLSTGEAAELCSVTRDTVLKWITSGRIRAHRTPGGHHRVSKSSLAPLIEEALRHPRHTETGCPAPAIAEDRPPFQYCWEFYARNGRTPEGCADCIVFRSGTRRCYELSRLPVEAGHNRLFCQGSCEDCEYFRMVQGQQPNVLVVTDRARLRHALERRMNKADFNLRITDCEYRCSMVIEEFRPDYVVIDCLLGAERSGEFATLLSEDPRIPFIKVVLAGKHHELPQQCEKTVFAVIDRPFSIETLGDLIRRTGPLGAEDNDRVPAGDVNS